MGDLLGKVELLRAFRSTPSPRQVTKSPDLPPQGGSRAAQGSRPVFLALASPAGTEGVCGRQ